jgi:Raf kinase inhibitor-like YbhB/YbcL family protein
MKDKQMLFITVFLVIFGSVILYLFLASRGIDFTKITLLRPSSEKPQSETYPGKIKITSTAFENDGAIPTKYTCSGADVNPPLVISGVPSNARSLALIIEDPDAPYKTWAHWIVYNISPKTTTIWENSTPWGAVLGENDFGIGPYRGPCPPIGQHRYIFRIYALSKVPNLDAGANRDKFLAEIKAHILDTNELVGTFSK